MVKHTTLDSSELIDHIATRISNLSDWRAGFSDLLEYINNRLASPSGCVRLYHYLAGRYFEPVTVRGGKSNPVIDAVFQQLREERCPVAIPFEYSEYIIGEKQYSIVGIPVIKNDDFLGAMVLSGTDNIGIRESQYRSLIEFSQYLIPLFEAAVLQEILLSSYLDTIETLAMALEAKDKYTRGHSNMVCAYATAIGRKMGFTGKDLQNIEIGSMMHDIGKIGIPDGVLTKPDRLTKEEFEIIKQHPVLGEQILKPMQHPMFDIPRKIVRWHHEQPNGKGYPDGLVGDEIPIECKITLVADAYDAMTSDRPYRKGLETEIAFRELRKHAGTQFDPDAVEALASLLMPPEV